MTMTPTEFYDDLMAELDAKRSALGRAEVSLTLEMKPLYDAGVGLRARFHVGDLTFPLRVEFPFYVSSPVFAQKRDLGDEIMEFRWLVSLQPIF